jgi:hypothetical protein
VSWEFKCFNFNDVFFNKDFYGNLYCPSLRLKDDKITALINKIWKERNSPNFNFSAIKSFKEYSICCDIFEDKFKFLLEENVKMILSDLKSFDKHDYVIKDDKIGYKEQDNISFDISYGYKTLFAYFNEFENFNFSFN